MTTRKKWLLISSVVAIFIVILIVEVSKNSSNTAGTGSDVNGLKIYGTSKLAAIVSSAEVNIIKNDLSTYVKKTDPNAQSALIESTLLDPNGSVQLSVSTNKTLLSVKIEQNSNNQLVFQVPSSNYSTTNAIPATVSEGDDD